MLKRSEQPLKVRATTEMQARFLFHPHIKTKTTQLSTEPLATDTSLGSFELRNSAPLKPKLKPKGVETASDTHKSRKPPLIRSAAEADGESQWG